MNRYNKIIRKYISVIINFVFCNTDFQKKSVCLVLIKLGS